MAECPAAPESEEGEAWQQRSRSENRRRAGSAVQTPQHPPTHCDTASRVTVTSVTRQKRRAAGRKAIDARGLTGDVRISGDRGGERLFSRDRRQVAEGSGDLDRSLDSQGAGACAGRGATPIPTREVPVGCGLGRQCHRRAIGDDRAARAIAAAAIDRELWADNASGAAYREQEQHVLADERRSGLLCPVEGEVADRCGSDAVALATSRNRIPRSATRSASECCPFGTRLSTGYLQSIRPSLLVILPLPDIDTASTTRPARECAAAPETVQSVSVRQIAARAVRIIAFAPEFRARPVPVSTVAPPREAGFAGLQRARSGRLGTRFWPTTSERRDPPLVGLAQGLSAVGFGIFRPEAEKWRRRESNPRPPSHRMNVYKLRLPLDFARRQVGSRPTAGLAILWCRASGDWLSLGAEPVF